MKLSESGKTKIQKYSRFLFAILAWLLLLGVVIQVSTVGLAILVDGSFWRVHRVIVGFIEFIPAFMYILGIAGGIPQWYRAWSFMLFIFINLQYYSVYGWLGAFHAAFALVIFVISLHVAWDSRKFQKMDQKQNKENRKAA